MRYAITFEVWDDESREAGETDNKGFSTEWTCCTLDDIWDLRRKWQHAEFGGRDSWRNPEELDYRTGETRIETLHIEGADADEISGILSGTIRPNALCSRNTSEEIRSLKGFSDAAKLERALQLLEELEGRASFDAAGLSMMDVMRLEDSVGATLYV